MAERKQDPIWIHFDKFEVSGMSVWRAKCKLCQKELPLIHLDMLILEIILLSLQRGYIQCS